MTDILAILVFGVLVYSVFAFHWPRILFFAAVLIIWGAAIIIFPIYLFVVRLSEGSPIVATLTILVVVIPAYMWWVAMKAGLNWCKQQHSFGLLWRPWHARI